MKPCIPRMIYPTEQQKTTNENQKYYLVFNSFMTGAVII